MKTFNNINFKTKIDMKTNEIGALISVGVMAVLTVIMIILNNN